MKIPKYCVPNADDRCISCRGRRISERRKRICPLYSILKKKDPVKLYASLATELEVLRNKIADLEETVQIYSKHQQLN